MSEYPLIPADDRGHMQMIPDGYDASRDRPEDNRSDRYAVYLGALMAEMDRFVTTWHAASGEANAAYLSCVGDDMANTWQAIREAMKA